MADEILVGDLVAEFLQAAGVTTAFGVVSVHNIPMLVGIRLRLAVQNRQKTSPLHIIRCRHSSNV